MKRITLFMFFLLNFPAPGFIESYDRIIPVEEVPELIRLIGKERNERKESGQDAYYHRVRKIIFNFYTL